MKRTDKYRDSYKYDNQYQNHKRRAEEDEYRNRAQSQNRPNAQRPNQHRDNRGFEDEPERYYNGRDYRREQQLEEENEKSSRTKMAHRTCRYIINCGSDIRNTRNHESQ